MIREGSSYQCAYPDCPAASAYCLEWWGVNQHGKNPLVVYERYSCEDSAHLIACADHEDFGGYPDEVYRCDDSEEVLPQLLFFIRGALDKTLSASTLENLVLIADPDKRQIDLFAQLCSSHL